jgi:hypothetical protein
MPPKFRLIAETACLSFAALGLLVAYAGESAIFAVWRDAAARSIFSADTLPAGVAPFAEATLGILGGSIFGKWIAAWMLVRGPLARGEAWAHRALVLGLLSWFVVDSAVSLVVGAAFNVWMINLAPLVTFGGVVALARPHATRETLRPVLDRAERALAWVCGVLAVFGIFVAVGSTSPIFELYRQGIADRWYDGAMSREATRWLAFVYAPIGATFLGHFAMLALAVLRDPDRREAWRVVGVSMLAWFLVDSSTGVWHRAWFNLAMVNVPSLFAVAVPWWLARPRAR